MPSDGTSPGEVEVVSVTLFDAGAGAPSLGMSPAEIEHAKAQVSAIAVRSRFMEVLLGFWSCKISYIAKNRATSGNCCKAES